MQINFDNKLSLSFVYLVDLLILYESVSAKYLKVGVGGFEPLAATLHNNGRWFTATRKEQLPKSVAGRS